MNNKLRVVVTGGSGRVGRYVLAELAKHHQVINADLQPCQVGPENGPAPEVEFLRTDVMDLDAVRAALQGADAVVHLAAIDFDWQAAPEKYISVNTLGTWHVLQAAEENNVDKVVLCSSISACGLSEMRPTWPPQALPVDESHKLSPTQAYSISKELMETMGRAKTTDSDMSVICIRPMAVVLKETLGEFIDFIDNPDTNWLYYYIEASDLARAFAAAVANTDIKFGSYYISADDTCRPEATLDWYTDRIGELPPTDPAVYEAMPRASIFSSDRAKKDLGWRPSTDFQEFRAAAGFAHELA